MIIPEDKYYLFMLLLEDHNILCRLRDQVFWLSDGMMSEVKDVTFWIRIMHEKRVSLTSKVSSFFRMDVWYFPFCCLIGTYGRYTIKHNTSKRKAVRFKTNQKICP